FKQPKVNQFGPRDSSLKSTTICDRESYNSKENTDDSLTQQPKTVSETSSVMSPLKVDKDWKEKFFHPANHIRVEEPKKARGNTDAPIIEDWVSDDEEEVEPIPKEEKKTIVPTATKKESVKSVKPFRRSVSCPNAYKHMVLRAVLMKTGLKTVNNAKPVNTVRSVNTARIIDDKIVQDQRQQDDYDLQDETQDQPKEEEVEPRRSKRERTEKSFGPDLFLL
ncbi:hypothetical protein Tco_1181679, partial [Tanacetum coccineum]